MFEFVSNAVFADNTEPYSYANNQVTFKNILRREFNLRILHNLDQRIEIIF